MFNHGARTIQISTENNYFEDLIWAGDEYQGIWRMRDIKGARHCKALLGRYCEYHSKNRDVN